MTHKIEVDMVYEISSQNDNKNDQALIAAINQSLDKSLNDIDEVNLQRLKNARVKALNHSSTFSRKWVQLGAAASVVALLLVPIMLHQQPVNSTFDSELEVVSQELPISVEEMDDIDMLMALEDTDA
jgi:hypothetical protein